MKYRLVISDYDGTLGVAPKNDIDAETLNAINKFIDKGGIFAVCSGRETSSIMQILKAQKIRGLVASFQGARITDIESQKELFRGGLSVDTALEALNAVEGRGLIPIAYGESELFIQERTPFVEYYERAVNLKGKITDIKKEVLMQEKGVTKICWLGEEALVSKAEKELNAVYKGKKLKFNSGSKSLLEAINPDCGKGAAVRFMADYYNIPLEQVMAVGDSTNDIDLLVGPWHGVCVGDGREELKAVADEITVPFEEKPIKRLIEKYCL